MMNTQQMELGLKQDMAAIAARNKARQARAQWWFAQMRRVVDAANPWQPAQDGRGAQGYLNMAVKRS